MLAYNKNLFFNIHGMNIKERKILYVPKNGEYLVRKLK